MVFRIHRNKIHTKAWEQGKSKTCQPSEELLELLMLAGVQPHIKHN